MKDADAAILSDGIELQAASVADELFGDTPENASTATLVGDAVPGL
jgi:hypothetical protein